MKRQSLQAFLAGALATSCLVGGSLLVVPFVHPPAPPESAVPQPTPEAPRVTSPPPSITVPLDHGTAKSEWEDPAVRRESRRIAFHDLSYRLDAVYQPLEHKLIVDEVVTFGNPSSDPMQDVELVVDPGRLRGVFKLRSIGLADGRAVRHSLAGIILYVALPEPVDSGDHISLRLSFELLLPAGVGRLAAGRQVNLGDWYPFVPAYCEGQGWLIHRPSVIGEYLVYPAADYQVHLQLDPNPAPGLKLASSGTCTGSNQEYDCQARAARGFALSLSPEYITLSQVVDGITINAYVLPGDEGAGYDLLQATTDAVRLYGELFGPYTHQVLSVVEGDFPDGLEYDGLYFLSGTYFRSDSAPPRNLLVTLAAHEAAHQWWGMAVGSDPATEPWLDEALATYSESLFYERVHPEALDWWWEERISQWNPTGWVGIDVYDRPAFRPYVNAVYLRGAQFLDDLRSRLGEQAFFGILRDYFAHSRGKVATSRDFWSAESDSSADMVDDLLDKYFGPRDPTGDSTPAALEARGCTSSGLP